MRHKLIIALLFLLTSCGGADLPKNKGPYDTTLVGFPILDGGLVYAPDIAWVEAAMNEWNEALQLPFFEFAADEASSNVRISYSPEEVPDGALAAAFPWPSICIIVAHENTPEKALVHELGHCLGLSHSSDNSSVMYFAIFDPVYQKIIESDIDRVNERYGF